jgi:hypothetical protein
VGLVQISELLSEEAKSRSCSGSVDLKVVTELSAPKFNGIEFKS